MSEIVTADGPGDSAGKPVTSPLSGAERQRRYKARKKASGKGPAKGTRPPFTPETGRAAALVHGASSRAVVSPVAAQIVADLISDPDCPAHLLLPDGTLRPRFADAVWAWGTATASVRLISSWLAQQESVVAALSVATTAEETTTAARGRVTRRSTQRQTEASLSALDRHLKTQARLADALGLTPASAARMRLETAPRYDSALIVAALLEEDAKRAEGQDVE